MWDSEPNCVTGRRIAAKLVGLVARRWLRGERRVNPPAISPYPRYLVFQVHY